MRPSQYHYIKRMWTREMYNHKGGLLAELFLFPFKVIFCFIKIIFYLVFGVPYWVINRVSGSMQNQKTNCCNITDKRNDYINVFYKRPIEKQNKDLLFDGRKNTEQKFDENKFIEQKLETINKLAKEINTTCEFDEFVCSFERLIKKLEQLSLYEDRNIFINSMPTKDLERIMKNKTITEKAFIDRYIDKYGIEELESKKQYLYFFSIDSISYFNSKMESV